MSHPSDIKWPGGSPPRSPVLLQRAESQYDVIGAALPQPSGGAQALLDGMYTELSRRHGGSQQLVLLTRRRHLLTLTRQFVVLQMSLMNYMNIMCELIEQSPPIPSRLSAMCLRLREVTSQCASLHRRLRGDPCLYPIPSPSMQDAIRNVPGVLLLMAVKAALLTEQFILRLLRRVAQVPAEVTPDLCRSLTLYNQVVDDLAKRGRPLAELRPFCLSRTLEILAEERGGVLMGEMCRMWSRCGLGDVLRREMETYMKQATDPDPTPSSTLQKKSQVVPGQRSPSNLGILVQEDGSQVTLVLQKSQVVPGQRSLGVLVQEDRREMKSHMDQATDPALRTSNGQVVPGQRSSSNLGVLIQGDRCQVTPVLQILVGLDQKMWNQVLSSSESAMYSQYCARLWPALHSQVFHALCLGMRGPRALPALPSLPEGVCASAVHVLRETFNSEDLPESCVSLGRSLSQNLLRVRSLIAWDNALCQALSSALTDKCGASTLGRGDPVSGNPHSRTSRILVTLCQHLSALLVTPNSSSNHPSPSREPWNLGDRLTSLPPPEPCAVICQQGALSRCAVTLHLCDVWLRSRAQIFVSSGSLGQLVLITHGDLPVIKAECRSLVAVAENGDWGPSAQSSCLKIMRGRDVLEGLVVSLPHVLGSVCSRRAQDVFQHMMPAGRHWRGKLVTGPDLAASEYAQAAVSAVVVPVLDGVTPLCLEEQVSAVCVAVRVFMEAWMGHILREKIKFSLQGTLQLRRDFESVRDILRSQDSRLSPEVVQAALALPVFAQADNAIVCLLQQPSRKAYLQSGSCVLFPCCPPLCRVAVDSMSDSLQSLDSLERRVWDGDTSRRVPRHSHDSYLPHNQRQWLSLRVHKAWNGLSLPWEGREVSEG
ncbi:coiled-coil domain-containing protein 142 isoform X2 [Rana temporaria]|uniref:coiled-coil domain-containing protein 142 isoform X2 n=1 Tax=Rana temporaria TaxID=8407 RepID=UPI001AAD31C5|nr:coiled-coil domain-containing protein 142 isoform X2 [Rana temporaria]